MNYPSLQDDSWICRSYQVILPFQKFRKVPVSTLEGLAQRRVVWAPGKALSGNQGF